MNSDLLKEIFIDRDKYEAVLGLINIQIQEEHNMLEHTSGGLFDKINRSLSGIGAINSLKKLRDKITLLHKKALEEG